MNAFAKIMGLPSVAPDETPQTYCHRLEALGFDEIFIRKMLGALFGLSPEDSTPLFKDLDLARLRYVALVADHSSGTGRMLSRRLSRCMGLTPQEASLWVSRFENAPVTYLPWFPSDRPTYFP